MHTGSYVLCTVHVCGVCVYVCVCVCVSVCVCVCVCNCDTTCECALNIGSCVDWLSNHETIAACSRPISLLFGVWL